MLITKSRHNEVLQEKDKVIATLQNEVAFLRSMVEGLTAPKASSHKIERSLLEANALLSGSQEQIDLNQFTPEVDAILSEREQILSGNY
jgi:hypothetical protein